jgi:hypothetical protein
MIPKKRLISGTVAILFVSGKTTGGLAAARLVNAMRWNLLLVVEIRQRECFFALVVRLRAEEVFEVGLDRDRLVLLEVDLAIDGHSCAGRDEATDDDVSLEAAQVVDAAAMLASVSTRVVSWNEAAEIEAVRRQGGFGDAKQEWRSVGGLAAAESVI